jgi:hypothetical protein
MYGQQNTKNTKITVQKCRLNKLITSGGVIIRYKFVITGAENVKLMNTNLNTHFI